MCIMFFMSHYDGPREHFLSSYHCAHIDCPGTFESHQKYRLEESRFDCSECLAKDGIQLDPDIVPVQYYPPILHFEIEYVEGRGWVKVGEQGGVHGMEAGTENSTTIEQDEQDDGEEKGRYAHSFASLSDCDSVTSHWRLDPTLASPVRTTDAATKERSYSSPYHEPPATEESYETRSPHEPHEMQKVCEISYEYVSSEQESRHPVGFESPKGDSPSTLEHRNLVYQQLATLEQWTAYREPSFNMPRPQPMPRHQRHNSKRRSAMARPHMNAIPPRDPTRPPPGPLPGGPSYENGLYYLVHATNPDWRWGPVPAPHERIDLSWKPTEAVDTRRRSRRATGPSKKKISKNDAAALHR